MTRKRKIQCTAGLTILVLIAWVFWPGEEAGELQVTYTGVSTNRSELAWCNLTNRSRSTFTCNSFVAEQQNGAWTNISLATWDMHWSQWPEGLMRFEWVNMNGRRYWVHWTRPQTISVAGSTNFQAGVPSTNRWRVHIMYQEVSPTSWAGRSQRQLSEYAGSHGFPRLSQWLRPKDRWKDAYGPEMLGNQPAPELKELIRAQ